MFNRRSAIVLFIAAISIATLSFAAAGTSAAGFSFLASAVDSVTGLFAAPSAHQDATAGTGSPNEPQAEPQKDDFAPTAAFTPGNLALLVAAASATNTTGSVVEINTTAAGQSAIQTIALPGIGSADSYRMSGSATSTGYVASSDDRTLLSFTGCNSTDTSTNCNALGLAGGTTGARAVYTLNNVGTVVKQTTYTGSTGNQTRGASSLNNTNWFIGDQGGFYTNGASAASPTGNIRSVKSFGGTVYAFTASATAPPVGTISAPTGGTFTGLPGLANGATSRQDFYLVQSGDNGSTYDILYVLDATSATAGTIFKYSLVAGNWTANGSYATNFGGFGLASADAGSSEVLYVSSGTGATTANSVRKLTDAAGYNATINITTANNVTLYTAAAGTIIKGLDFAPIAAGGNSAPTVTTPTSASITPTTATLGGNVTSDGGSAITERGVVYSLTATNNDPTIGGTGVTKVTASGTTGIFTTPVTGLTASSGYSFKAYATNSVGTTYTSPVSTFTTSAAATAPTVTSPTTASITDTTATLGGNVTSDGGDAITERGVVYSQTSVNANPQIGGMGVVQVTASGTTGVFTAPVTGLTAASQYSFKAYATNGIGTTYTTPASTFTTLAVATQIAFVNVPTAGSVGTNLAAFTVEARRPDNTVDTGYTGNVVITKASGTGNLTGTLIKAAVAGVATFNDLQFDAAGTYTLNADSGTFTQITSASIVISVAPPFTAGNIVVCRVGDGSAALGSTATAVFLDEYSSTGTYVRSVAMPTAVSGSNKRLTASGSATSECQITRTANGLYLNITGYDADLATAGVASSSTTVAPIVLRVIGRVDGNSVVDTSTTTTSFSGNNIRSAVSSDGINFYAGGAATGSVYLPLGGSGVGTVLNSTVSNIRVINIFNGQLYGSTGSGSTNRLFSIGTGLPTTTGQTIANVTGTTGAIPNGPYAYSFSSANTFYVADNGAGNVKKFSGGIQVGQAALTGVFGLTARNVVGGVEVYATTTSGIYKLTDASGDGGTLTATFGAAIATAATNTGFRGIAFAPIVPSVAGGTYANLAVVDPTVLAGDVTVTGNLTLSGVLDTGSNTLKLACGSTVTNAGPGSYVLGNVQKDFCATGAFSFPVGENGYTPVNADITTLTTNPSSLKVRTYNATLGTFDPSQALARNWDITETGDLTATLSFTYLAGDVVGNEADYRVWRLETGNVSQTNFCPGGPCVDPVNHVLGPVTGVTQFSRWTGAGPLAPTAAAVSVAGRVTTADGRGIRNAAVTVSGNGLAQPLRAITGPFGYYSIDGLDAGGTYVVTVNSKSYTFRLPSRVINLNDSVTDADFVADPRP